MVARGDERLQTRLCRYADSPVRVQVVTHMWPSEERPEHGIFVRDQVEALRRLEGIEIDLKVFPPGASSYLRAAWKLRSSARRDRVEVVHAHYGLSGWSALASRGRRSI